MILYTNRTDAIWYDWATSGTNIATNTSTIRTTVTGTQTIWTNWLNETKYTSASTGVWHQWVETTGSLSAARSHAPQLTPEELRVAQENAQVRAQRYREEQRELTQRLEAAEKRAEQLLVENLSLRQRDEYLQHKAFTVHGRNARYRIRRGRSGNVDVVNEQGIITHRLCAHPGARVPDCDTMLAQKLMLEFDEPGFLRKANHHPVISPNQRAMAPLH